ncbi:glycosyltransferase [Roseicitreum antarcticum]|uniref:Glycosyltransferase involved in cell wall bisynthesis n=1 Tax=Roseicitreum antarcticum TaxID=564137 RepID=A0A1H2X3X4_9RHOB|nr:glycosyltransferase [Roseicitreum antarcticum]SDW87488.1 Glycosyltransferase involved in cell wall bisynthesis [Roseicitreum antarcticum]
MKILFIHQNFPGQFLHLAPALKARGHQVLALTAAHNQRESPVETVRYPFPDPAPDPGQTRLGRTFTAMTDRGHRAARAARQLRDRHGFVPDVVFGHCGWGETLFLHEVWPDARHLSYAEFFYGSTGLDVGFDPEFSTDPFDSALSVTARQAHLALAMLHANAALTPTEFQADTFPAAFRDRLTIIHDGIDTARLTPDPSATVTLPDGTTLRAGDEVLTFMNRNLEPYRGYHIFMRALPDVLAARPHARVVIVGGDDVSYGARPPAGRSWKTIFLDEVADRLDPTRVHFTGKLPYDTYMRLMQVTRVHAYLTVPFVLSWSLLEAMSMGCAIVASKTAPVQEVITDGVHGRLVDFFDIDGWATTLTDALAYPESFRSLRHNARAHVVENYDLRSICLPRLIRFVEAC